MPKRLLLALAAAALAIVACSSGSSSPSPTVSPGSPLPNPSIKKATIFVSVDGTPAANVPVEASTPKNTASPRPGTPFATEYTGKKGLTHFHNLKPSKTYCWVAIINPSFKSSACATWEVWQSSNIDLGT
jgi:hypothetical protein